MSAPANKEFPISPIVLFSSAFLGVIGIATIACIRPALQNNVLFLVILAMLVAAVFAFLPMTADVKIKSVQFTGSAAIFCWLIWYTVPSAQEIRKSDLLRENEVIEFNMSKAANLAAALEKTNDILRLMETTMDRAKSGADKAKEELGHAAATGRTLKSAVDRAMSSIEIAKSARPPH
jgi:hypothetical protein